MNYTTTQAATPRIFTPPPPPSPEVRAASSRLAAHQVDETRRMLGEVIVPRDPEEMRQDLRTLGYGFLLD